MADDSLIDMAAAGQCHKSKKTFFHTLRFNDQQWGQFWRLLTVGCIMSDHLLDAKSGLSSSGRATAKLWNELAEKLAHIVNQEQVVHSKEEIDG